jgi:hypothetical protein
VASQWSRCEPNEGSRNGRAGENDDDLGNDSNPKASDEPDFLEPEHLAPETHEPIENEGHKSEAHSADHERPALTTATNQREQEPRDEQDEQERNVHETGSLAAAMPMAGVCVSEWILRRAP